MRRCVTICGFGTARSFPDYSRLCLSSLACFVATVDSIGLHICRGRPSPCPRSREQVDRSTTAPFNFWVPARGGLIPEAAPGQPGASTTLTAGLSFLPTFFGLHLSHPQGVQGEPGAEALSPEQAQQALLSRLLLLLRSMVILCLLLF